MQLLLSEKRQTLFESTIEKHCEQGGFFRWLCGKFEAEAGLVFAGHRFFEIAERCFLWVQLEKSVGRCKSNLDHNHKKIPPGDLEKAVASEYQTCFGFKFSTKPSNDQQQTTLELRSIFRFQLPKYSRWYRSQFSGSDRWFYS